MVICPHPGSRGIPSATAADSNASPRRYKSPLRIAACPRRRSIPLWRSDTACCGHAETTQDQNQIAGLSLYVPLFTTGVWGFDPYIWRSAATAGSSICVDTRKPQFANDLARKAIAEAKSLRPFYEGDYYPLLGAAIDERQWCAWQYDRPDLGAGFAIFFRRSSSPYPSLEAAFQSLDPNAMYEVSYYPHYDLAQTRRLPGSALARLRVDIAEQPGTLLIRYQKTTPTGKLQTSPVQ